MTQAQRAADKVGQTKPWLFESSVLYLELTQASPVSALAVKANCTFNIHH